MHNRFFYILFLLVVDPIGIVFAQINLVPNPSFEEYENGCPANLNEMPIGWYWWQGSPNSFNTCVEPQNLTDSLGWAPWTGFGTQAPLDGQSFVGLYGQGAPGFSQDYREYLGCELLEPMVVDSVYQISFKASLGFGNYYEMTWACNRLGALLTMQGDYDWQDNPFPIPNFAHVFSESIISDTTNWVTVEGTVVADQAYTYMVLGVLYEYELLDTTNLVPGSNSLGSYYFIDNIQVEKQTIESTVNIHSESELSVFPNPTSDKVLVRSAENIEYLRMQDSSGRVVKEILLPGRQVVLDVMELSVGVYHIEVGTEKGTIREKLVIVH